MRARVVREYKLELATMVLAAGILLTLIGLKGVLFPTPRLPVIDDLATDLGAWNVWLAVIGPLFLIGGSWVVADGVVKRREFNDLIETTSKATFVRNLDRLEELAWYLSADHERRVIERKRKFRVK